MLNNENRTEGPVRERNDSFSNTSFSSDMVELEILFIRHAESIENMKMQSLSDSINRLKEWRLLSRRQISLLFRLCSFDIDSNLSFLGHQQIEEMKRFLDEQKHFWKKSFPFDLCVFSPYQRTRETCQGIIPHSFHSKCVPVEELKELSPYEHIFQSSKLDEQIVLFQKYLFHLSKNIKKIVIIGHSKWFLKFLSMIPWSSELGENPFASINTSSSSIIMRNCDIWKIKYAYNIHNIHSGKIISKPQLIYRSPISLSYPADSILQFPFTKTATGGAGNNNNNNDNPVARGLGGRQVGPAIDEDDEEQNELKKLVEINLLSEDPISDDEEENDDNSKQREAFEAYQRDIQVNSNDVNKNDATTQSAEPSASTSSHAPPQEEDDDEPICRICQVSR